MPIEIQELNVKSLVKDDTFEQGNNEKESERMQTLICQNVNMIKQEIITECMDKLREMFNENKER